MRALSSLAVFAALFAASVARAPAAECPTYQAEDTIKLLSNTKTCKQANYLLGLCSWNTSMDVHFADIVQKKCENDFLPRLPQARRAAYAAELKHCVTKYAHESGTMYVSFTATCKAAVAGRYSARARQ